MTAFSVALAVAIPCTGPISQFHSSSPGPFPAASVAFAQVASNVRDHDPKSGFMAIPSPDSGTGQESVANGTVAAFEGPAICKTNAVTEACPISFEYDWHVGIATGIGFPSVEN